MTTIAVLCLIIRNNFSTFVRFSQCVYICTIEEQIAFLMSGRSEVVGLH